MTSSPPSFSIITCTWNSARYLPRSIASVLSQTCQPSEYIFVDGGSTDGTLELIGAIPRNVILLSGVQGGVSRAMNAGLRVAGGDVVAHLHSDDYYLHPGVLQEVAETFTQRSAEWVFGTILNVIDGQCEPLSYRMPRYSYRTLLRGNFIPHPATFVRRRLIETAGYFDEEYRFAMDYALWLELGKLAEPVQIDRPLTAFRRHPESLSTKNRLLGLEEDFKVRMRYAGDSPLEHLMHYARYLVRRQRLVWALGRTSESSA